MGIVVEPDDRVGAFHPDLRTSIYNFLFVSANLCAPLETPEAVQLGHQDACPLSLTRSHGEAITWRL